MLVSLLSTMLLAASLGAAPAALSGPRILKVGSSSAAPRYSWVGHVDDFTKDGPVSFTPYSDLFTIEKKAYSLPDPFGSAGTLTSYYCIPVASVLCGGVSEYASYTLQYWRESNEGSAWLSFEGGVSPDNLYLCLYPVYEDSFGGDSYNRLNSSWRIANYPNAFDYGTITGNIGAGLGLTAGLASSFNVGFGDFFYKDGALTNAGIFAFTLMGLGVAVGTCALCFHWVTGRHGM